MYEKENVEIPALSFLVFHTITFARIKVRISFESTIPRLEYLDTLTATLVTVSPATPRWPLVSA